MENERTAPSKLVAGTTTLDGLSDRSTEFEIWFIRYLSAFAVREMLSDDAESFLKIWMWLKDAIWYLFVEI